MLIYVSSQAQHCVPRAVTCTGDSQCNGLCEFSAFSLATLVFLDCSFSSPPPLSAAFYILTLCGAAGVIVLSQVLFASAVQWFCSILLSQLANALPSVLLYCVLLFRTQVQLSCKATPVSLSGELVFHGKKFQSLSLYFLGKHLAQGSEPNRRVFPSWIQVCWQKERLRLPISVLFVPLEYVLAAAVASVLAITFCCGGEQCSSI